MAAGRGFVEEEYTQIDEVVNTVVLSYRLWQNAFNGDPGIIGTTIPSGNQSLTVVGIASPEFDYPVGADLWLPHLPPVNFYGNYLEAVGRLAPNVNIEQAQAELDIFASRFEELAPIFVARRMVPQDLKETIVGDTSTTLFVLLGSAAALLLIACANVMNLLLSRGDTRTREIALRAALGASPWRLIRELITESMTLATAGTLLALVGTTVSLRVLAAVGPASFPRLEEVSIDGNVLLFAMAATAFTGLIFGLLPAVRLAAADIKSLLGGSARGSSGVRASKIFSGLVLAQTGLAVTLVIGAGLLIRSYERLQSADGGFRPDSVLVTEINIPGAVYPDYRDVARMYEQLIDRVEDIPGVVSAGVMSELPLGAPVDFVNSWTVLGQDDSGDPIRSRQRQLSPGVFETLALEVVEGRALTEDDRFDVSGAAVLNETFARLLFGNTSALGQQIRTGAFRGENNPLARNFMESYEVVGVVRDVRHRSLDEPSEAAAYLPLDQFTARRTYLTTRVTGRTPESITNDVRAAVGELDPTLPLEFQTMESVVAESLSGDRLAMLLLLAFA